VRRDPEETRQRLLRAAVAEFSRHGFAGGRIERISASSGANRERIYANFGDKRGLFEAVLETALRDLLASVEIRGEGLEALGAFALDYFDATAAHPELARLAAWEGLELGGQAVGLAARSAAARLKIDDLAAAAGLPSEVAAQAFLTAVTLSHGWATAPNVASVVLGPHASTDDDRRRGSVCAAVLAAADG